jgi:hypothetical protein
MRRQKITNHNKNFREFRLLMVFILISFLAAALSEEVLADRTNVQTKNPGVEETGGTEAADATGEQGTSTQESTQGQSRFPRCTGARDIGETQNTAIQRCLRFREKFEQYARESGILETGVDMNFIYLLAAGESQCYSRFAGDERGHWAGIMQTTRLCSQRQNPCQSIDDEIRLGMQELKEGIDTVYNHGFQGRDAALMLLFLYNRGPGTLRAVKGFVDQGMNIEQASQRGCEAVWSGRNLCYDWIVSKYHCNGNEGGSICDEGKTCSYWSGCWMDEPPPSIQIHYAGLRWDNYLEECRALGGEVVAEGAPIEAEERARAEAGQIRGVGIRHPYFTVPYSVEPAFSTELPYDFSIYDEVPRELRKLERCLADMDCVLEEINSIENERPEFNWIASFGGNIITENQGEPEEPEWEAHCEETNQHAINSIAEAIDNCARSQDRECVCSYKLPIIISEDIDRWYGRAVSTGIIAASAAITPVTPPLGAAGILLGITSLTATEMSDIDQWEERIITFSKSGRTLRIGMREPEQSEQQTVRRINFTGVSGEGELRGNSGMELRYTRENRGESIDIYKDSRNVVMLYPEGEAPSTEQCEINNKMLKFCITQDKTFFAYNEQQKKLGLQNLVLKFAYLLKTEINDVPNFEVKDARMSTSKLLLMWDAIPGADIEYYTVYYSDNPGAEANLRGQNPAEAGEDVMEGVQQLPPLYTDPDPDAGRQDISISVEELLRPRCVVEGTTCNLGYALESAMGAEEMLTELDDERLYYSTVDEKYFYLLPNLADGQAYFFAITATDTSERESQVFNLPVTKENPEDDAPPGLAEINNIFPSGDNILIEINSVNYNIDGSALEPDAVTKYKIYCFATDSAESEAAGSEDVLGRGLSLEGKTPIFVRSNRAEDGTEEFLIPATDFDTVRCETGVLIPAERREARIVVAGVKTVNGRDVDYRGRISEGALSAGSIIVE